jgi:ParB-like chromosome segregation protein Spo0J
MDDLQIAWRPLGELIPYARNPRTHADAQVAQIAASIKEFGWTNPVLVDGQNGVIAGHGRVLAARKLGLERGASDRARAYERGAKARLCAGRQPSGV